MEQKGKNSDERDADLTVNLSHSEDASSSAAAVAIAELVSKETTLDPAVVALLENVDSFYIQQQVRWTEALTQGCIEQSNVYAVIDKKTNTKIMVKIELGAIDKTE
jgi:hypothetical protein